MGVCRKRWLHFCWLAKKESWGILLGQIGRKQQQQNASSKLRLYVTSFSQRLLFLGDTAFTTCDWVAWLLQWAHQLAAPYWIIGPLGFFLSFSIISWEQKNTQHPRKNNFLTMGTTKSISTQTLGGCHSNLSPHLCHLHQCGGEISHVGHKGSPSSLWQIAWVLWDPFPL